MILSIYRFKRDHSAILSEKVLYMKIKFSAQSSRQQGTSTNVLKIEEKNILVYYIYYDRLSNSQILVKRKAFKFIIEAQTTRGRDVTLL